MVSHRKHKVLHGWNCFKFPSFSHHKRYFCWMILTFPKSGHVPKCISWFHYKCRVSSWCIYFIIICKSHFLWFLCLVTFSVPSVFPRNVTAQLDESRLVISWKPPPDDKINGILRGYDVIIRYGPHMTKVSTLTTYIYVFEIFLYSKHDILDYYQSVNMIKNSNTYQQI